MPHRPEKREGQVIGGMLRLFQKWLPRLRAGLDSMSHLFISRITLIDGVVSSLKCIFSLLLYLDFHLVPHVTGLGDFLSWCSEPIMPSVGLGLVTATWPSCLFWFHELRSGQGTLFRVRPVHPAGRGSLHGTLRHRASQAALPVHFLGFQTSGFFSPLFSSWFHISQGRHGNCPVGSGQAPGTSTLALARWP